MGDGSLWAEWRKSSYSADINCVEFRIEVQVEVGIRDSKDCDGPRLRVSGAAWKAFTTAVSSEDLPPVD
ncbi:DUF397 domain-containing protein [Catenuloplanes japonicus]|uniref:DUF397 domain-containing protein n=1 Tax=Catenuloplanes japonicus TaxID=33876 RepID=UPI000A102DEC|nr:DUF397 domain-containing protein [Catenuloplanes japonicus]